MVEREIDKERDGRKNENDGKKRKKKKEKWEKGNGGSSNGTKVLGSGWLFLKNFCDIPI